MYTVDVASVANLTLSVKGDRIHKLGFEGSDRCQRAKFCIHADADAQ